MILTWDFKFSYCVPLTCLQHLPTPRMFNSQEALLWRCGIRQWQEEWTGKIHVNYPKLSKKKKKKHYFSSQQHDRHGLPKSSRNILHRQATLGHPQSNMHNSVSQADKDHVLDLILPAEVTRDQVGDLAKGAFWGMHLM